MEKKFSFTIKGKKITGTISLEEKEIISEYDKRPISVYYVYWQRDEYKKGRLFGNTDILRNNPRLTDEENINYIFSEAKKAIRKKFKTINNIK